MTPTADPDIRIDMIGGNCPVQAEGTVNGVEFYFRARHAHWRMNIGGDVVVNPAWSYSEPYGEGPHDAGWMEESEARGFIAKAAEMFARQAEGTEAPQVSATRNPG
jgi:hypothetical protein